MTKRTGRRAAPAPAARPRRASARRSTARRRPTRPKADRPARIEAVPVTARDLRALKRELERKAAPMRWNPNPEDVQKSVAQLVLTIVEFLRKLMERQAIRRMDAKTLTPEQVEAVGLALMRLEETVVGMARQFGLRPEDLNLDLGPVKLI